MSISEGSKYQVAGKAVIVTGASSGIGEATAKVLAHEGAKVAICGRRSHRLKRLAEEIEAAGGIVYAARCDMRAEEEVHRFVNESAARFGGLDVIVNNAGVMLHSRVEEARSTEWRKMIETNLLGLLYATSAAIPHLERRGYGDIINLSSVGGRKARATSGVYSATKWGVIAISEALRLEVMDRSIRVTVIEPGLVQTEIMNNLTDPAAVSAMREHLNTELLRPENIAHTILWTISCPRHMSVNEILVRPLSQAY